MRLGARDDAAAGATRQSRQGRLGFVVTACLASAALAAPIAIGATGSPLREGLRNPGVGSAARETLIIARTPADVYGTRQSTLGAGGAAIYGCRTRADFQALADTRRSTPCLRVNNLSNGLIYSYRFAAGGVGGVYQAGPTTRPDLRAKPFITNATGVATGLNADQIDGVEPADIIASVRAGGVGPQGPKGATGDKGATGPPGEAGRPSPECSTPVTCPQWFTGADSPPPPGLPGSDIGDFFLDVAGDGLGNVYEKTGPLEWRFRLNIRGPAGRPRTAAELQALQPYVNAVVANYCDARNQCRR